MSNAVAGHKYALILSGFVHSIFTGEELPGWNEKQVTVVDITSVTPAPQVGWSYNGSSFAAPVAVVSWAQFQAQARAALVKSDVTVIRCAEDGVTVPADWKTYRTALRAIVSAAAGTAGTLPAVPVKPAGV